MPLSFGFPYGCDCPFYMSHCHSREVALLVLRKLRCRRRTGAALPSLAALRKATHCGVLQPCLAEGRCRLCPGVLQLFQSSARCRSPACVTRTEPQGQAVLPAVGDTVLPAQRAHLLLPPQHAGCQIFHGSFSIFRAGAEQGLGATSLHPDKVAAAVRSVCGGSARYKPLTRIFLIQVPRWLPKWAA